jgi:hypothetical protein
MVKPTPPIAPEAPLRSDAAFSAKAQTFLTWLSGGFYSYVGDAVDFVDERADEALAAATTFGFPSIAGKGLNLTRVNAAGTALEFRTPAQVRADIGATAVGASVFMAVDMPTLQSVLGFAQTLAVPLDQLLPGGLRIKAGSGITNALGLQDIVFPVAFPTALVWAGITSVTPAPVATAVDFATNAGMQARTFHISTGFGSCGYRWSAIGY